ncbi:MAG: hypothetical protein A2418_01530 [Candidatus Brennerbacteria bacterium RIFOXYC1_FULL_41_11]|uniref:Transcription elongation factor GreA/GreB C-terminal domain-containing protein n=1 Tax=Candidatus Brennerbacteria bacterium RIFOXYD1_FULL_41_16 TaxID=1797529 RepID=A0A1G1XK50_9BACT|nr:MAG: hypothetical protein A2418_01530 [Candidatus Brennerbacteria bacterium RIFOXYC1_FULL_41_11]OGY39990.1 MAG: hypothetical protein A2570_00675 [Candidatus Brennerbacteria bacterium RIFOXYD1_FULL_41_16]
MSEQSFEGKIVCLYDKVKVRMADGSIREFCIVHPDEAEVAVGKISNDSPVAQAALGSRVGEKKEYIVAGNRLAVEVLEITKPV